MDSLRLGRTVLSCVKSLTLPDAAIPGLAAQQTYPLPYEVNLKMWQFSFNVLPELPEVLTKGREKELFNWLGNPTRKADPSEARPLCGVLHRS
jgi:hypothetical protein